MVSWYGGKKGQMAVSLSRHVQEHAPKGDLDAVLHAVEDFAQKVRWLKAGRFAGHVELEMTSSYKWYRFPNRSKAVAST